VAGPDRVGFALEGKAGSGSVRATMERAMSKWILCLALLCGSGLAWSQAIAPTLADLKKQFETSMREAQKANREELKALRQSYTDKLTKLQTDLQAKGQMQAVLAVRDEKTRFEGAGEIPSAALITEPAALRKVQDDWNASLQQLQITQAQKLVALSEKYMQQLALLQKTLTARNDQSGLKEVSDETDRLLGNNVIREALALAKTAKPATPDKSSTTPPKPDTTTTTTPPKPPETKVVEVGDYKFYPTGKEPAAKDLKDQRLEFATAERRNAAYFYSLGAKVYFDKAKLRTSRRPGYDVTYREEAGDLFSVPRITLASRNKDIPEGSKIVIQYYSRHIARASDVREERVEHIKTPALARGQSLTVDGEGITLYKYDYRSGYGYRERSGREFYGLIISVFDPDGKMLIQQCTPSSLIKVCGASLVAEKEQERNTRY
jgi:Skp family chaperone for outer membrane proteins